LIDVPSRRNSGFIPSPKSRPATFPEACSSAGRATSSVLPGSTVLRTMTVWRAPFSRIASPICVQTRST
jgi:hypothetical protein